MPFHACGAEEATVCEYVKRRLVIAIPEGSQPFLPKQNPGIGSDRIPGFWDDKNSLELYFFRC